MRAFAKRLRELRERRNLTQKNLADLLDVQVALVSRYERGLSVPSAATLIELGRILHVTTDELLTGSIDGPQPPPLRNPLLFERFRRLDEEIDDRREIETVVSFLDAFLAKKQIKRLASA